MKRMGAHRWRKKGGLDCRQGEEPHGLSVVVIMLRREGERSKSALADSCDTYFSVKFVLVEANSVGSSGF